MPQKNKKNMNIPSSFRGYVHYLKQYVVIIHAYGCFQKKGYPKSSILIGFSLINHPFWSTIIFGNTHIYIFTCTYLQIIILNHDILEPGPIIKKACLFIFHLKKAGKKFGLKIWRLLNYPLLFEISILKFTIPRAKTVEKT